MVDQAQPMVGEPATEAGASTSGAVAGHTPIAKPEHLLTPAEKTNISKIFLDAAATLAQAAANPPAEKL